MRERFDVLVRDLAAEQLEELRQCVATEMGGRRQKLGLKFVDIHPLMTSEERERAAQDIARVLRGE